MLAAYSCGGSRGIGSDPSPRSLLVPHRAGTDDACDYSGLAAVRKRASHGTLTKAALAPLSASIDGLSDESEQGTRYGMSLNPRLPPQL